MLVTIKGDCFVGLVGVHAHVGARSFKYELSKLTKLFCCRDTAGWVRWKIQEDQSRSVTQQGFEVLVFQGEAIRFLK